MQEERSENSQAANEERLPATRENSAETGEKVGGTASPGESHRGRDLRQMGWPRIMRWKEDRKEESWPGLTDDLMDNLTDNLPGRLMCIIHFAQIFVGSMRWLALHGTRRTIFTEQEGRSPQPDT